MSSLVYTVYLADSDGRVHAFGPGDSVPDWACALITNPLAWGDEVVDEPAAAEVPAPAAPAGPPADPPADVPQQDGPLDHVDGPPPQGGPGASRKLWADYATANGVAVESAWKRDDIIAACEKAGVPV